MPEELFETRSGYDRHGQIAVLQDGRVIAYGKNFIKGDTLFATCEVINIRVPDLRMIEYVLNVQFDAYPDAAIPTNCVFAITPLNKVITGNVVGMTLGASHNFSTGGTMTVEVIAIGPP